MPTCAKIESPAIAISAISAVIDLRTDEPRRADVALGGVKLLARVIDKGRAALAGTLGPYVFFDCPLDQIFLLAVNVRCEFLDVLRQAYTSSCVIA